MELLLLHLATSVPGRTAFCKLGHKSNRYRSLNHHLSDVLQHTHISRYKGQKKCVIFSVSEDKTIQAAEHQVSNQ